MIDSSAWVEWLVDTPLGARLNDEFPEKEGCIVPTIVQLEIHKWLTRQVSGQAARRFLAHTQFCIVIGLDTPLAIRAAEISVRHKLSTADAIIYATALDQDADLLTCDAHFKDLPHVVYLAKAAG